MTGEQTDHLHSISISAGSPPLSPRFVHCLAVLPLAQAINFSLHPKSKLVLRPPQAVSADSILLHLRIYPWSYLDRGGRLPTGLLPPCSLSFLTLVSRLLPLSSFWSIALLTVNGVFPLQKLYRIWNRIQIPFCDIYPNSSVGR